VFANVSDDAKNLLTRDPHGKSFVEICLGAHRHTRPDGRETKVSHFGQTSSS